MQDLVGPTGTLVMPAFPIHADLNKTLMIDSSPSSTGLLTELFRRFPNVHRSIHLRSSVCALGPQASQIVDAHHLTEYCWGPETPYDRIRDMRGLMVSLGSTPLGFTPLHYVECVLHNELNCFSKVFSGTTTYRWQRKNGDKGTHTFLNRHGHVRPQRIKKYFTDGLYQEAKLSNLRISSMAAYEGITRTIQLARDGITYY
jgi:aminoglycoside 3-N-acetyltransferase